MVLQYQERNFSLATGVTDAETFVAPFTAFVVTELTGSATIRLGSTGNDAITLKKGLALSFDETDPLDKFWLSHGSQSGDNLRILFLHSGSGFAAGGGGGTSGGSGGVMSLADYLDETVRLNLVTRNAAFGATPTLMPIAGVYDATPVTHTDGDAAPILMDVNGRPIFLLSNGTVNLDLLTQNAAFGTGNVGLGIYGKTMGTPTVYDDLDAVPLLLTTTGEVMLGTNTKSIGNIATLASLTDIAGNASPDAGAGTDATSTTTGEVVGANANRKGFEYKNLDATDDISLAFGTDAINQRGIVLKPGQSYSMPYPCITSEIDAIASANTPTGAFIEW